ncbi:glycosyltransferase family 62 protein [Aulographum hederae CBS 113979]|uniref:Glycosyltransferase family 62 protein n=1 Tax=Aulographum hederae CBS 113979 TaxID=1176131 RepID=A0A6G1H4X9_9PEZI|nr:glycosyltransferase family 62 protein [Aulographum hederae CBS 113979]
MLIPKGGVNWKAARSRLPPWRALLHTVTRARFLVMVAAAGVIILLWRALSGSAGDMQRFYCFGPAKSPMDMTPNEQARWNRHPSPLIFNHHTPVEVNSSTIEHIDLNPIISTAQAASNQERILILTPLRDAAPYLPQHFDLILQLTYPHNLIDLAFLVGDSRDDTMGVLATELDRIQKMPDSIPFRSATIIEKDFGVSTGQTNVEERHGFKAQGPRRKAMGKARNYLLSAALKPEHSWVYWRDVDIQDSPKEIIEDFTAHDKDILVPNIWFHRYREENGKMRDVEGRFDYNSWQESPKALKLAASLDKNVVLAEGYKEYDTGRTYMAKMGDWREDKDEIIELDGIGGVNIMVKANVHRAGINFPCYAFENQAETEGFAKMAKRAGYGVFGLPNYVVWHIDTDEKPGNAA